MDRQSTGSSRSAAMICLATLGACSGAPQPAAQRPAAQQRHKQAARATPAQQRTSTQMATKLVELYSAGQLQIAGSLLDGIPPGEQGPVQRQVLDQLLSIMEGDNRAEITPTQLQAKDALFELRQRVSGPRRRALDQRVVSWLLVDLKQRAGGVHSAEVILRAVGRAGFPLLLRRVIDPASGPRAPVAALIKALADQPTRDSAAKGLVLLAGKQAAADTFLALGTLGGDAAVDYLKQQAAGGAVGTRILAVRALMRCPQPGAIKVAKTIAADRSLVGDALVLRDEAFTLLEKIQHPQSLEALAYFLTSQEVLIRYRATEAMLSGFKAKGLRLLLARLPPRRRYKKADLKDFVEEKIAKLGASARPALLEALGSTSWIARLVAVRCLAKLGRLEDIPALVKLKGDRTRVRGWRGRVTIGSAARGTIETIRAQSGPVGQQAAGKQPIGVASCDAYLTTFERCARNNAPKGQLEMFLSALKQAADAWRQVERTPRGRRSLDAACKTARAAAKRSLGAWRCTW